MLSLSKVPAGGRASSQIQHVLISMLSFDSLLLAPDTESISQPADALASMVSALEEDIVFGRLHPRERLVEDDLMTRFEVKRHIARDALAALDRMGLIERRKNVGALVRSFSTQEVEELYELRVMLETQAASKITFPVPQSRLDRLIGVQRQHDAAVAEHNARLVFRTNLAFHQELFALAGNETLRKAIAEYARQTHPIRFASLVSPEYRERARTEHWEMIEALRSGERGKLMQLCADHLLPSRDAYLNAQQQRL